MESYLRSCRKILRGLGRHIAHTLQLGGVTVDDPQGGFYLFPDFSRFAQGLKSRGITDSPALCKKLLEDTGVAIIPGNEFGRDSGRQCPSAKSSSKNTAPTR